MMYIIDANNLAGKLDILKHDDFDRELIEIVKDYFFEKKMRIVLVFDSNDLMGDKIREANLEIIYTPRDNFYNSADDKVLELVIREIEAGVGNNQITVVTDDIELREKVQNAADKVEYSINIIRSSDFANRIKNKQYQEEIEEDERGLSEKDEDNITNDLLKIWKS